MLGNRREVGVDIGGRVHGNGHADGQIRAGTGGHVVQDDGRLVQYVVGVC